jgi:hypothetical protein
MKLPAVVKREPKASSHGDGDRDGGEREGERLRERGDCASEEEKGKQGGANGHWCSGNPSTRSGFRSLHKRTAEWPKRAHARG